jgi:hypothetical protein
MSGTVKTFHLAVAPDTPHLDVLVLAHRSIKNFLREDRFRVVSIHVADDADASRFEGVPTDVLTYCIQYERLGKSGLLH